MTYIIKTIVTEMPDKRYFSTDHLYEMTAAEARKAEASTESGVEFNIGTGFTAEDRRYWWNFRNGMGLVVIKYKFFPIGVKDKPRHPVYLGLRPAGA